MCERVFYQHIYWLDMLFMHYIYYQYLLADNGYWLLKILLADLVLQR